MILFFIYFVLFFNLLYLPTDLINKSVNFQNPQPIKNKTIPIPRDNAKHSIALAVYVPYAVLNKAFHILINEQLVLQCR